MRAGATEETVHAGTAGDFDARQEVAFGVVGASPSGRPERLGLLRRTAAPPRPTRTAARRRVRRDALRRRLPNGRVAAEQTGRRVSAPPAHMRGQDVARDDVLCRIPPDHVDAADGLARPRTDAGVPRGGGRGPNVQAGAHDVLLLRRLHCARALRCRTRNFRPSPWISAAM